jgi:glycosyltransferase involved in cell wall biosynthesis
MPSAWLPHQFFPRLPAAAKVLRSEIDKADYLQFALGGLWGDWPSVAAILAHRSKRKFSVWTDHVESQVCAKTAQTKSGVSKLYWYLTSQLLKPYERYIISNADLGLFHGADCFDAYAKYCSNPHLVHNIHIGRAQHISDRRLRERLAARGNVLRVAYAGRASHEKGTLDWVRAIAGAHVNGTNIAATWFGSGPELTAAQHLASSLGAPISFPGPLPHDKLLETLKTFDAFVFCHKTLESPRGLIEALACGLPIIGYHSPYPDDLLSTHRGGILVEMNSVKALATTIRKIADQNQLLEELSIAAKEAGSEFTDEAVFAHRSDLIKTHTPPSRPNSDA